MLRQQDLRLAYKFTSEFDCNWKLFNENGMDVYHFSTLHADSFGEHIPVEEFRFDLKEGGGFTGHYTAAPTTFDGKSQFGPMPWMEDKPWYWARMGFKLPNLVFVTRYDTVQGGTIWPTEPGKSQFVGYCLLPPAYFDQPGFREKVQVYEDFFNFFLDEDKSMVPGDAAQHGLQAVRSGPRLEAGDFGLPPHQRLSRPHVLKPRVAGTALPPSITPSTQGYTSCACAGLAPRKREA